MLFTRPTATLLGQVDSRQVRFRAKGETLQEPGWLSLVGEGHEEADGQDRPEGQGAESNQVPPLDAGQRLQPLGGEVLALKTRAPKRYTKASLIGKLESEGIGRPATYAAIMGNIERRGYITTRKLFLHPTETAFFIVDQLTKAFSFIAVDFTREVESELDRIASGQGSYLATVEATHDKLRQELASLETSGSAPRHPCPDCGSAMRRIPGKTGHFWGCSGYPACNATRPDKDGSPAKETPSDSGHCARQLQTTCSPHQKEAKTATLLGLLGLQGRLSRQFPQQAQQARLTATREAAARTSMNQRLQRGLQNAELLHYLIATRWNMQIWGERQISTTTPSSNGNQVFSSNHDAENKRVVKPRPNG
jgi:hypothetical protein